MCFGPDNGDIRKQTFCSYFGDLSVKQFTLYVVVCSSDQPVRSVVWLDYCLYAYTVHKLQFASSAATAIASVLGIWTWQWDRTHWNRSCCLVISESESSRMVYSEVRVHSHGDNTGVYHELCGWLHPTVQYIVQEQTDPSISIGFHTVGCSVSQGRSFSMKCQGDLVGHSAS